MRLEGKVALVTGAGQGIGRGIALALAAEGADVALADVKPDGIREVAQEIRSLGRKALEVLADVSSRSQVEGMVATLLREFGRIDILVNNAAISVMEPTLEVAEETWDKIIAINLKGTFLCCQACGREMIKLKRGKIINIASGSGLAGTPNLAAYSATKGGVIALTKTLSAEWAKHNVNVNSVLPGRTKTPMAERAREAAIKEGRVDPAHFARRVARIPLGREAMPEDIAKSVVFFASAESDYLTGQILLADGGILAVHPGHVE